MILNDLLDHLNKEFVEILIINMQEEAKDETNHNNRLTTSNL
jgi:hypothetical protein